MALVTLGFVGLNASVAAAQSSDLGAAAADLGSDDAQARHQAVALLSSLPAAELPAIGERLTRLRRARPTAEEAADVLTAFRRATGSRRADDLVDLAAGVETVLATRRDAPTLRMAEPLLLLRSLEAIGTVEALRLAPEVFRLDGEPWRMEGRRVTLRMGDRVAAAAIHARADQDNAEGRTWARWTSDRLGLDSPGSLAQRLGPTELADVLRAFSATHTLSAIPVIASFVDADQRRLRDAAREAFRGYRQNSIWVARETYRTRLGEEASIQWGWERTLDELYAGLDSARAAHVHEALAEARGAIEAGDPARARGLLDAALVRSPELATIEAATLYAELASSAPEDAPALLRRALAISPDAEQASSWRGRLTHLEASSALARGTLDAEAFARAAALAPACRECVEVHATLSQQGTADDRDRTVPLAIAAALFALLGLLLVSWTAGSRPATATPPEEIGPEDGLSTSPGSLRAADDTSS